MFNFRLHQLPNTFLRSIPKYAREDNNRKVADTSSKLPMNGIPSGMSSNIPNPGLRRYNPDSIPILIIMYFFINNLVYKLLRIYSRTYNWIRGTT